MLDRDFVIEDATIILPSGIAERSSLKIEDGTISKIREGDINSGGMRIKAKGRYILPGFIDLHCDAIEKEIEPRPNSYFPVNIALFELDKKTCIMRCNDNIPCALLCRGGDRRPFQ